MATKTKLPRPYALLVGFNADENESFTCAVSENGRFFGAGGREVFPSSWSYAPTDDVMRMQGDDDGAWHQVIERTSTEGHSNKSRRG